MSTSKRPDRRPVARRQAARRRAARLRKARSTLLGCVAALLIVCLGSGLLLTQGKAPKPAADTGDSPDTTVMADANAESDAAGTTDATAAPALSEAEQRIADATAQASANTTGNAPTVTDPDTWNAKGKELMDRLSADEFFVSEGINVNEKEGFPYLIAVNRAASTVTVYTLDEDGRYTVPYMATQSFLVSYVDARGLDLSVSLFFPVYAVVLLALRFALKRRFDTVRFGPFLLASSVCAVCALVLLAVMRGDGALFAAAACMAGGYGVMCSVCQATAVRLVGPEHAGMANSTYYMGLDIGMALGPMIGGMLFGAVDLGLFYPVLAVTVPLALAVYACSRSLRAL